MQPYRDLTGDSNVEMYEIGDTYIKVKFKDGTTYTYTHESAGKENVEAMKKLAAAGDGLNAYINEYVKYKYESKE